MAGSYANIPSSFNGSDYVAYFHKVSRFGYHDNLNTAPQASVPLSSYEHGLEINVLIFAVLGFVLAIVVMALYIDSCCKKPAERTLGSNGGFAGLSARACCCPGSCRAVLYGAVVCRCRTLALMVSPLLVSCCGGVAHWGRQWCCWGRLAVRSVAAMPRHSCCRHHHHRTCPPHRRLRRIHSHAMTYPWRGCG